MKNQMNQAKKDAISFNAHMLSNEERLLKDLAAMSIASSYNKQSFSEGEAFYNSGLEFQDAPISKQSDISFKRGFEKAKRDAYIKELSLKNKIR